MLFFGSSFNNSPTGTENTFSSSSSVDTAAFREVINPERDHDSWDSLNRKSWVSLNCLSTGEGFQSSIRSSMIQYAHGFMVSLHHLVGMHQKICCRSDFNHQLLNLLDLDSEASTVSNPGRLAKNSLCPEMSKKSDSVRYSKAFPKKGMIATGTSEQESTKEFRYFKFEIRLGRRNHEIRSEVVLSCFFKQLKIQQFTFQMI